MVLLAVAKVVQVVRNAGPKVVSMSDVAAALGQCVGGRPQPSGKVVPEIDILAGGDVKPDAGVAPIALEASDPCDRSVGSKLFSKTGEVQEEGDRLVFRSTASGPHEVTPDGSMRMVAWRCEA